MNTLHEDETYSRKDSSNGDGLIWDFKGIRCKLLNVEGY